MDKTKPITEGMRGSSCTPANCSAWVETVTERFCGHVISSTVRPATKDDIQAAKEMYEQGKCPHNIVTDEQGWLYDFRSCYICGKGLGTV